MSTKFFIDSKPITLRPAQQIALGFLMVIFVGSVLLSLPFAQKVPVSYLDNLFIATSAVSVTGLAPIAVVESYTLFGQIVLIFLMQLGGLSLMTFIALMLIAIGSKLNVSEKIVMQETLNRTTLEDISSFIKFIVKYTLLFQLIGVILLSLSLIHI